MEFDDNNEQFDAVMPTFFVDKWVLLAIVFLIIGQSKQASFRLPELDNPSGTQVARMEEPFRISLTADGQLVDGDENPVVIGEFISELQSNGNEKHVDLAIQIRDDGSGATQELLQLQANFLNAGIADRLHIQHTKKTRN